MTRKFCLPARHVALDEREFSLTAREPRCAEAITPARCCADGGARRGRERRSAARRWRRGRRALFVFFFYAFSFSSVTSMPFSSFSALFQTLLGDVDVDERFAAEHRSMPSFSNQPLIVRYATPPYVRNRPAPAPPSTIKIRRFPHEERPPFPASTFIILCFTPFSDISARRYAAAPIRLRRRHAACLTQRRVDFHADRREIDAEMRRR